MANSEFDELVSLTISHIGISNYSSGKIRKYLLNKGYSSDLIEDVIDSLIKRGYIDDRKASRSVLLLRTGKKRESRSLTYQRLIAAGISEKVASEVIEDLPDDKTMCKELLESSLSQDFDPFDDSMRNRALKLAISRGFTFECAQNVLSNLEFNS